MGRHNSGVPLVGRKETPVPAKVLFRCHPELKLLLEQKAQEDGLAGGVNEFIVRLLGGVFERPDLGKVPRRKPGPRGPWKHKRKAAVA
jgi:hypothetical protein